MGFLETLSFDELHLSQYNRTEKCAAKYADREFSICTLDFMFALLYILLKIIEGCYTG